MHLTNKAIKTLSPLLYSNNVINITKQHKLLGVIFDDNMSFKPHITELCLKLSRIVSLLYQVRDLMPNNVLKILYSAHVFSVVQCISYSFTSPAPATKENN